MVRANGLTKSFGGDDVVSDLDLELEAGQILGLIGPSGCGKTTTVRLLTGLLRPTSGTAEINGVPSIDLSSQQRREIGYLPQIPALFEPLSLSENLHFHASMYGLPLRRGKAIDEMLEFVELTEHRKKRVSEVSGGMQRRLALAAALIHEPTYVFLDEPTAGIDPILRERLWSQFRWLREGGRSVVVTTQYVGEAAHCDVVGLISDGELLMLDTPEQLRRAAFDGEVVDVHLERPPTEDELHTIGRSETIIGDVERLDANTIRIVVENADHAIETIDDQLSRTDLVAVSCEEHLADFEEAFVRVVERHRSLGDAEDGESSVPDLSDRTADEADQPVRSS